LASGGDVESEMQDLDLYKLLKVFQKVITRYDLVKDKPTHEVIQFPYTIAGQREFLLNELIKKPRLSFLELIAIEPNKIAVIFNFLSILDLLQLHEITLHIGDGFNNFWIEKIEETLVDQ